MTGQNMSWLCGAKENTAHSKPMICRHAQQIVRLQLTTGRFPRPTASPEHPMAATGPVADLPDCPVRAVRIALDPELPFPVGALDGRNAQIAVIA